MKRSPAANPRMVLAFLAGAVVAAVAIAVWSMATPYARAQEGDMETDNVTGVTSTRILALNDVLKAAGSQLQDSRTKAFYERLVDGYGLDAAGDNVTNDWLPDIDKIQRHALTLPLQEAGKNIRDKDIADFYARFLRDAGLIDEAPR